MNFFEKRRRWTNFIMMGATFLAALIALIPLFFILSHLISKGLGSLHWSFFTELPAPVGEPGGGMANGIVGSFLLVGIACLIGLPVGILGGIYLSEYGRGKLGNIVRFATDMLNGIPSIVIGIFVYAFIVIRVKHFSALAGGIALGIMMIPTVLRSTETMMNLVPQSLREGSLALGIPYWRTLVSVVFKTAQSGILTGVLLAISRIAGETAPLLFTALGNQFWNLKLDQPIAALPLQIFTYAISPYEDWQKQAWVGALVLIGLVLLLNIAARTLIRNRLSKPTRGIR